jgi:hypothetical protein
MSANPPTHPVAQALHSATLTLASTPIAPFSRAAFSSLKDKISEYIDDLVTESVKVSKRHRADTVSSAHVAHASDYLVASNSRRVFRHLGTVGGILLGAALSNILTMTLDNKYSSLGIVVSVSLAVAGTFLVALHIAKD